MRLNIIFKMEVNRLAQLLYKMQGYNVPDGYDFEKAKHPQEKFCWNSALLSYQYWEARLQKPVTKKPKKRKGVKVSRVDDSPIVVEHDHKEWDGEWKQYK
jgi:hypothetical protein